MTFRADGLEVAGIGDKTSHEEMAHQIGVSREQQRLVTKTAFVAGAKPVWWPGL